MRINQIVLRAAMLGWAAIALAAGPARADEITPEHLQAALEAVSASRIGAGYDNVLPAISESVQGQLIRLRPDLYETINKVVSDVALTLVPRRADLANDIARVWANTFSEDDLKAIAAFYSSDAGKKYLANGPKVLADTAGVLKGWSDRVGEELLEKSREALKQQGVEF